MNWWAVGDLLGSTCGFGMAGYLTGRYLFLLTARSAISLGLLCAVIAYVQQLREPPA
jgi:hypothetical protein